MRREQGRLGDVLGYEGPIPARGRFPLQTAFRTTAALLDAERGAFDDARKRLARIVENGVSDLARDHTYLYNLAILSELCHLLGDAETASELYPALEPFADRHVILLLGAICLGSASRHLGQLAATMGDDARADAHFKDAVRGNDLCRARLWSTHAKIDWAQMLIRGGGDEAMARADLLIGECKEIADELSLRALRDKTVALESRLSR